jgi:hypothetical protein
MTNTKICARCKLEKEIDSNFTKAKRYKDGIRSWCRDCDNKYIKQYRHTHPKSLAWKEGIARRARTYRKNHPEASLLAHAKQRAKKLGIPFAIKRTDIKIPEYCPVLGIKLTIAPKLTFSSTTLDRIIPKLGYVPGNIAVISLRANQLKNNASLEELEALVNWMSGKLKEI